MPFIISHLHFLSSGKNYSSLRTAWWHGGDRNVGESDYIILGPVREVAGSVGVQWLSWRWRGAARPVTGDRSGRCLGGGASLKCSELAIEDTARREKRTELSQETRVCPGSPWRSSCSQKEEDPGLRRRPGPSAASPAGTWRRPGPWPSPCGCTGDRGWRLLVWPCGGFRCIVERASVWLSPVPSVDGEWMLPYPGRADAFPPRIPAGSCSRGRLGDGDAEPRSPVGTTERCRSTVRRLLNRQARVGPQLKLH